ncbi:MAG TPA: DUF1579 domain-containing protein [Thermoanaerobaculia bacterium]|jgi:hypothetical protein
MKSKALLVLALLVVCTSAVAQEPKQDAPDQKAMMDAMMKAMMPGDAHKLLEHMVGTFDVKVTAWMMPGQPPMDSNGTAVNTWILGGRFVQQKFSGQFMGQPFEGVGYTGYDNVKKTYWSSWMDNMSTGVMNSIGGTTDGGKTWKFMTSMPDPMTGKEGPVEERLTVVDHDHHNFEMWSPGPDGKMMKTMALAYSRKQ